MADLLTKDLVVLVADKNMEFTAKGILASYQKLGTRPITSDIYVHPGHDPGCYGKSGDFLRLFISSHKHAIVIFDHDGCGHEQLSRIELEQNLGNHLENSGWAERAVAIAIDPELESWVWSDSPQVDRILGWEGILPNLREWLIEQGFLVENETKPDQPKEALEAALRKVKKPRSSAIYLELAQKVSFERCVDESFLKLKDTLRQWFPKEAS
jgi:hypothetical protein